MYDYQVGINDDRTALGPFGVNSSIKEKLEFNELVFKCIRIIGPKYIRDFFNIREMSYNLEEVVLIFAFPNLILIL